ncbi:DNA internalization-related competence protein ComEC/Rec2 [bacterium (Candidatus Blackallbacteria) CG17_big_fil_post_rev_8_21_14_2_50_48_46]|uniref:DNA internalization-related competence protein ComEC/Rec2 n=1 Tax=bacterium (Candidatus Blackallbacteria) CG17_big_fil_post_rev_8_21_14_2_50_48_46 TaxID=2014261 RepID=A0A2M7FX26_9BACT|nr:MAG: DNA internalization-related competence protein ComEC/Rec2 [bacterium (Candidatus Blackallbacteria) CG18_big_fil_WC_8_21_14_2_50_49_26]PIW13764.1 MAG: DNA internalization-related competence protein ComEC/Rec2 [bacterium (Candidatus Blackallbacteria) CG17_big_fil_post_rev_8_21_14_2_50_48_46]PIW44990.1 MAG: DNA internalization-related competence protein ComEC/Rec2 [bacterium (Candidatus Blackallbacteria) CG13_big_fil_rev_8_21_14_2_50_49_14]
MNPSVIFPLLAFALGIGISAWPMQAQVGSLMILGLLLALWGKYQRFWLKLSLLCLFCSLLGFSWAVFRTPHPSAQDPVLYAPAKQISLSGRVLSARSSEGKLSLRLKAHQLKLKGQTLKVSGQVQVQQALQAHGAQAPEPPAPGSEIQVTGSLDRPLPALNFGDFSYRDYLARQGVFSLFRARELKILKQPSPVSPPFLLHRLRQKLYTGFARSLPSEHAALLGSLILGEEAASVPEALKERFRKAGLQHVLAVSGFQVQLLLLAWLGISRLLRLSRRMSAPLGAVWIFLYMALTGFTPSVLRAGLVGCLGLIAWSCFRRIHALQALILGAGLLLVWRPQMLFEVGFQFSVLATLGLIWGAQWAEAKLDFLPLPLAQTLGALLTAQAWVLPVQLYHFGEVSPLIIPANLWASLFVSLLTWMSLAGMGLGLCLPTLWSWLAPLISFSTGLFLNGVVFLAALPLPSLSGLYPSGFQVLLCLSCLLILPWLHKKQCPPILLVSLLLLPLLSGANLLKEQQGCPLRVTYLYVGQGDGILIEYKGQTVLIDAGPRQEKEGKVWDAGLRHILPYLKRRGIARINHALISHAHQDHAGGFSGLLDSLPIEQFWAPAESPASDSYLALLRKIQSHHLPLHFPKQGEKLVLAPDLELIFWQGQTEAGEDHSHGPNNQSLVVQMRHQNLRFLFAGDIEKEAENALLASGLNLKSDIYKIPHHGSDTSSQSKFIAAVAPREGIVSVGVGNQFGHPVKAILERYAQQGSRVWRTDQQGAVCVCSQGKSYQIGSVQK